MATITNRTWSTTTSTQTAGSPIGLLLTLTYATSGSSSSLINRTKNAATITNRTKNAGVITNRVKS